MSNKGEGTMIKVVKLSEKAVLPTKAHEDDAGYDVYCTHVKKLKDGLFLCHTGLSMTCDEGSYIRVAPRSGLAVKGGCNVLAGVVDRTYRGEVCVVLYSPYGYVPLEGERVAQLIETRIGNGIEEVESLDSSSRGLDGWGSTGI